VISITLKVASCSFVAGEVNKEQKLSGGEQIFVRNGLSDWLIASHMTTKTAPKLKSARFLVRITKWLAVFSLLEQDDITYKFGISAFASVMKTSHL